MAAWPFESLESADVLSDVFPVALLLPVVAAAVPELVTVGRLIAESFVVRPEILQNGRGGVDVARRAYTRGDLRQRDSFAVERMLAVGKRVHPITFMVTTVWSSVNATLSRNVSRSAKI